MALKQLLGFAVKVIGDGTDATVSISVATAAMGIVVPEAIGGHYEITPSFSLASLTPAGIIGVTSANGHAISATILAGTVTVTYAPGDMPIADEIDVISGNFTF